MKKFKRFILSLLLTKQERAIIWNSLWYSRHTYKRRGNIDGAVAVQMVMSRTEGMIVPKGRKYSEKEVSEMIDEVIKGASKASNEVLNEIAKKEFHRGYRKGRSERTHDDIAETIAPLRPFGKAIRVEETDKGLEVDLELNPGMETDHEKCESCDVKEGCFVFQMIFGDKEKEAADDSEKATEGEDTEKEEKSEEQAPEGTAAHHEVPSETEEEKKSDEGK